MRIGIKNGVGCLEKVLDLSRPEYSITPINNGWYLSGNGLGVWYDCFSDALKHKQELENKDECKTGVFE